VTDNLLELGILDVVDVLVVAVLVWLVLRYLRRTRAGPALLGLTMLGGVYLVARWLSLELTAALFQAFFAVLVLVMVVVFQDDLRRVFEQLGAWGARRTHEEHPPDALDIVARAAVRLAASRTGALIVIARREPLERHLEGGIPLGGRISEPLLLSLFDAHSPGHDGAVVLRGDKVERFATHLPLSADHEQLGSVGTRHAAALGLAERCDAVCVVVSEERGTVSIARDGLLTELARPGDVVVALADLREKEPARAPWRDFAAWREAGLAVAIALALWLVFVPGAREAEVTLPARVVVERLPEDYRLESVAPEVVEVTLSGRRRDLLLARGNIEAKIDALLVKLGRRSFEITADDVSRPAGVEVVRISPARVRLNVASEGGAAPEAETETDSEPAGSS
jgi:diadenylate cyclase